MIIYVPCVHNMTKVPYGKLVYFTVYTCAEDVVSQYRVMYCSLTKKSRYTKKNLAFTLFLKNTDLSLSSKKIR
jgi:hypothetical protein